MDDKEREQLLISLKDLQQRHQKKVDEILAPFQPLVDALLVKMQDAGILPYPISDEELKLYTDFFDEIHTCYVTGNFTNFTAVTEKYEKLPQVGKDVFQSYYENTTKPLFLKPKMNIR